MIIAGYDAILDQSDQQDLYNHLSNYTKYIYVWFMRREFEKLSVRRNGCGHTIWEEDLGGGGGDVTNSLSYTYSVASYMHSSMYK